MLILKVQYNILNYAKYEGSRYYYVQNFHYVQLRTYWRKYLWTFSCDVCIHPAVHLLFHWIWTYPQIISNANIFITGWKHICSVSEAWDIQPWFGLIFLWLFQLKTHKACLVFICLCLRCIYCYRRNIPTKIYRSKYELVRYLLYSILDR